MAKWVLHDMGETQPEQKYNETLTSVQSDSSINSYYCLEMFLHLNTQRAGLHCYIRFFGHLSTEHAAHIASRRDDELHGHNISTLSLPLGNSETHNNQSLQRAPLWATALIAFGTRRSTLRALQAFYPFCLCRGVASPRPLLLRVFGFHLQKWIQRDIYQPSCPPPETVLVALLQAWLGKTGRGNFTMREWHLHVYLHLFTAVVAWKQPRVTEREDLKGQSLMNALKLH